MITTTIEPASSKDSSSLSSSDLVSRFLAATPSYLYDVPPIQQNFFFSEMLRSYLPLHNDAVLSNNSQVRRRKRSWRDSRELPLELTTNQKNNSQYHSATQTATFQHHHHHHHHHHQQSTQVQQYPLSMQNHEHSFDQQSQNSIVGTQTSIDNIHILDNQTGADVKKQELSDIIRIEEKEIKQKNKSMKTYYLERLPLNSSTEPLITSDIANVKIDKFPSISTKAYYTDQSLLQCSTMSLDDNIVLYSKNKSESKTNFFSKIANLSDNSYPISNFRLPRSTASDFTLNKVWHPQYSPSQTNQTVDPLHFFIDFRVSGHIWDRNTGEKIIFPRTKHNSAFNVPQPKEYNRPLNLTRNESIKIESLNKSANGTHHIFKNIKQTYQRIWTTVNLRNGTSNENPNDAMPLQKENVQESQFNFR